MQKIFVCFLCNEAIKCFSEGESCNDCANFDTFMKLGMVEDNHLRIGKSMGDKLIIFQLLMTSSINIKQFFFHQNITYYISIDSSFDTD